jgi:hypothetical protein
MRAFYINILVLSVLANIAGWLGAFIYASSGQYSEAMIYLSMCIIATVVYTMARKVLE